MRLFVALDVDDRVRQQADALMGRLRRRLDSNVKWVPAANLHVTLSFIGQVSSEEVASRIRQALATPIETPPFEMAVSGLGMFPERGGPRVIWAGLVAGAEAVVRVQRDVARRLEQAAGLAPESRPFHPHVTLGRYRTAGRVADRRTIEQLGAGELGRLLVDHVTLYESRLSPKGPTYIPLMQAPLSATI
jgi:2'-5' RNA ligase